MKPRIHSPWSTSLSGSNGIEHSFLLYQGSSHYVFGGCSDPSECSRSIGRLDDQLVWSLAGMLNSAKMFLSVIFTGEHFLVVGADTTQTSLLGNRNLEKCGFNQQTKNLTCAVLPSDSQTGMILHTHKPILLLINDDYASECTKNFFLAEDLPLDIQNLLSNYQ